VARCSERLSSPFVGDDRACSRKEGHPDFHWGAAAKDGRKFMWWVDPDPSSDRESVVWGWRK